MSSPIVCTCSALHIDRKCPQHSKWILSREMTDAMPTIALCVMVKNEEATLPRLLDSVKGFVDRIVALDTGSTDDTIYILESAKASIKRVSFVDFGRSRTELMEFAKGKADWLLLMDADQTLRLTVSSEAARLSLLNVKTNALSLCHAGALRYWVPRLVRGNQDWRYVGSTHEYLDCGPSENFNGVEIVHHADGGARSDKFERDERLLRKEVADDPTNSRAMFYLANTLRDLGRTREAIDCYQQRARMGGWDEEVYVAKLNAARLARNKTALWEAYAFRPTRAEALWELEQLYSQEYRYEDMFKVHSIRRLLPPSTDILFVETGAQVIEYPPVMGDWRTIPGWCDFTDLYSYLVAELPTDSWFVEVGTWVGQSFACFAYLRDLSKKRIHMVAVDTFQGSPSEPTEVEGAQRYEGSMYKVFCANMQKCGVRDFETYRLPSVVAARRIPNESVNAVFIDAEHQYEAVKQDLEAWYRTVKRGGFIGGHDYDRPEVKKAVDEFFEKSDLKFFGRSWLYRKNF